MKKVFKYLRHSMLLAAVTLFAFSCAESEVVDGQLGKPSDAQFSASTLSFDFAYEGGSSPITITSPDAWSAESDADWCYASLTSGANGTSQLHIMAAPNTTGKVRTATITLKAAGQNDIVLSVSQAASPADPNLVVAQPDQWDGKTTDEMIYEILVYAFADSNGDGMGDFQGIISKLDYIEQLGAGALWLSPIHPADSYHGYDVTDYNAVNPKFGTKEDFRQLVDACHQRGIKVYLDYVVNHTGKGHSWYTSALEAYKKGEKNEYWNYYMLSEKPSADVADGVFPMLTPKYGYVYGSDHWKNIDGWPVPEATTHRYKFTLDWTAKTIKVEPTEEAAQADNSDTTVEKFIYFGETGAHHRMYDKGNGQFELITDFLSPWGFLVLTSDSSWTGTKYGSASGEYIAEGEAHKLALDAGDIQFDYMRTLKVYARLFSAWMPDLNYGEIETVQQSPVYQHILASIKGWLDLGVDGLRVDAAKHIYFQDFGPANLEFWRKLYGDANAYYKTKPQADGEMYLVAELFSGMGENKVYASVIPSFFNFDFWWQSREPLKQGQGKGIAQNLLNIQNQALAVNPNFIDAVKLTNHDEPRAMYELGDNRHLARVVGSILLTQSGRPVVYNGEELGYSGTNEASDINIRQPMKWTKTEYAKYSGALDVSFANVKSVEFLLEDEMSVLNAYRKFGQLRRIYPSLTEKGKMIPAYKEAGDPASLAGWYRQLGNETLLVLHNVAGKEISFKLYEQIEKCVAVMGEVTLVGDQLTMPAYSSVIFKVTKDQL